MITAITVQRTLAILLLLISLGISVTAQTPARTNQPTGRQLLDEQTPTPSVVATASSDRVRYISIGEVQETRLQVFSDSGMQVYDSGLRRGNLVEWRLTDQQGDGSYLFLITVKEFNDRLTQKYGIAILEQGKVYLEQRASSELNPTLSTLLESSRQTDALSPVDRIGVAGLGGTSAIASSDDASSGLGVKSSTTSGTGESAPAPGEENLGGTGTQNRVAKWIDNAANLGDSIMFDNGSGVGVGTTDLTDVLVAGNDKFKIVDGPMTFSFRDFSGGQGYFAIGSSTNGIKGFVGHTNTTDGFTLGTFSNHKLTFRTNSVNRLTITESGNVGIGVTSPSQRLTVSGGGLFTGNLQVNGTLTANLPSGDSSYIQNRTGAEQPSSNFIISGNGTVGGTLQGGVVNATSEYRISSVRVLDINGLSTYVGLNAGGAQSGSSNSFFGFNAGADNTGSNNSFFGRSAGAVNQSGSDNSFFGMVAGDANTTGSDNSFFGSDAGGANTEGIQNSFFGSDAGDANTLGSNNSFFGRSAGGSNTNGIRNSFFGSEAGQANISADFNSYFGYGAGLSNANGGLNSFFGYHAGRNYTGGSLNAFFGSGAGQAAGSGTGSSNSFFGSNAGFLMTNGSLNTFVGADAGRNNSSGSWNTFVGAQAGERNTTGIGNTYVGYLATGSEGLINSGAIGNRAEVLQHNSLVLGSINGINGAGADTYVGIGTRVPLQSLHVKGIVLSEAFSIRIFQEPGQCIVIFAGEDDIFTNKQDCAYANDGRAGTSSLTASDKTTTLTPDAGSNPYLAATPVSKSSLGRVAAKETSAPVGLFGTLKKQQEQIRQQQEQIDGLKRLVCQDHPEAAICK